jgi:hypothetical protein
MGDYDFEPKAGKSLFLRLKDKDQVINIRLASKPYREPKVWKTEPGSPPMKDELVSELTEAQWFKIMKNPDYEIKEAFHWLVVDRDDGEVKIFTATATVYKKIKEYAQKPKWGDPTKYDIEVKRTEEPGSGYYSVSPDPDKSDLTDNELFDVRSLKIEEKIPNARLLSEKQVDDISEYQEKYKQETAAKETVAEKALAPNENDEGKEVGISGYEKAKATRDELASKKDTEDLGEVEDEDFDKPVDLADIPF